MTEQRRIIARVLSDSSDHPDVESVHRRAAEIDPRISIATVYRTVRLFEEANILARHDFGDGRAALRGDAERSSRPPDRSADGPRRSSSGTRRSRSCSGRWPSSWAFAWSTTASSSTPCRSRPTPGAPPQMMPWTPPGAVMRDWPAPTTQLPGDSTPATAVGRCLDASGRSQVRLAAEPPPRSPRPRRCATASSTRRWAPADAGDGARPPRLRPLRRGLRPSAGHRSRPRQRRRSPSSGPIA